MFRKGNDPYKQQLSFNLDIGIVNNTFRNDFAYTNHAPLYNDENIFEDYQFDWFTGFRVKSSIDYIRYNNNNTNAVKISYKWEGIHAGDRLEKLAVSNSILQISLLHRLN